MAWVFCDGAGSELLFFVLKLAPTIENRLECSHMIGSVKIRPYNSEDRPGCLELFKSNIPKFFLPSELSDFNEFLAKYTQDVYWVLEDSGKILACGGIGVRNGEGRLHYGIVANDRHRKGLGSRLIKFRLGKLIENSDVVAISLDTSQHNPKFFNRFGFVETSRKENAYGPGLHRYDMRWVLPVDAHERALLLKNLRPILKTNCISSTSY